GTCNFMKLMSKYGQQSRSASSRTPIVALYVVGKNGAEEGIEPPAPYERCCIPAVLIFFNGLRGLPENPTGYTGYPLPRRRGKNHTKKRGRPRTMWEWLAATLLPTPWPYPEGGGLSTLAVESPSLRFRLLIGANKNRREVFVARRIAVQFEANTCLL